MKSLHVIADSTTRGFKRHTKAFVDACLALNVSLVFYDANTYDVGSGKMLGKDDMVYRLAATLRARALEKNLLSDRCAHLYSSWTQGLHTRGPSYFIHTKVGVPVVPTRTVLPNNEQEVKACINELGPLPLVVKVFGNMMGVGVMRVDTEGGLRSLRDYLRAAGVNGFVRKFIEHDFHIRAVVLGDRVITAYTSHVKDGDFRTNLNLRSYLDQKHDVYTPTAEEEQILVKAVRSLDIELGGVDVLVDKEGEWFISEVNFPLNFQEAQQLTGVDIQKAIVEHLLAKTTKE